MSSSDEMRILLLISQEGNARVLADAVAEIGEMRGVWVRSANELGSELDSGRKANAAIVDTSGFGQSAWAICDLLQAYAVPFIVLSPGQGNQDQGEAIARGAASALTKPVAKAALMQLVTNMSVN